VSSRSGDGRLACKLLYPSLVFFTFTYLLTYSEQDNGDSHFNSFDFDSPRISRLVKTRLSTVAYNKLLSLQLQQLINNIIIIITISSIIIIIVTLQCADYETKTIKRTALLRRSCGAVRLRNAQGCICQIFTGGQSFDWL